MLGFMTLSRDSKGWAYQGPLWEPLAFLPNRPARVMAAANAVSYGLRSDALLIVLGTSVGLKYINSNRSYAESVLLVLNLKVSHDVSRS